MKKTININLAGTFFHIDEDAFGKLQRYLDAIKRSLTEPQGSEEIIRDIEARIAELFSEKIETNSQVISLKELDEVIAVMGQPEDYAVDEELFEDTVPPSYRKSKSNAGHKQLFRDIDTKFISGVSSGMAHYVGIDAIWIRLIWILLTIATSGFFILVYILFWILVPAAVTTSDKLKMTGQPINISNIEKKFKEGYESVADNIKNADYDKYGQKVKSGASGFFETLGSILLTLLKIFVKFIGVILVITSLSTLIGLIIGLFTFGSIDLWGSGDMMDYITLYDTTGMPVWLFSLLVLFAVGIPFFVLFILGMKLLVSNLKSIGRTAKIVLFVVWIFSLIGLGIWGVKQATSTAYNGDVISEALIPIKTGDTLKLAMRADTQYEYDVHRHGDFELKYNNADQRVLYSNDVRLIVRSTNDSTGKLIIRKSAEGISIKTARTRAEAIEYNYSLENNTLLLDGFLVTDPIHKYRDQEVEVILYLPIGTILQADENTYSFHRNDSRYNDILNNNDEGYYVRILKDKTECLDCPDSDFNEMDDDTFNFEEDDASENENWKQEVNAQFNDDTTPTPPTPMEPDEEYNVIITDSVN
ncbi:PspC domain-containing protein [Cochleicola gelatinilyticus]|uniref:PspC domain-containing protein n=1 Tax=Cochleicola gelatinilyticus TaxID=1763537 RepID=UPI00083928E1|nr:PspC domain-containing protein [Cochleicola gelatinilyticus]